MIHTGHVFVFAEMHARHQFQIDDATTRLVFEKTECVSTDNKTLVLKYQAK